MLRRFFTSSTTTLSSSSSSALAAIAATSSSATTAKRSLMLFSAHDTHFHSNSNTAGSAQANEEVMYINGKTSTDEILHEVLHGGGKYLCSNTKLEHIHRAYLAVIPVLDSLRPVETYEDYLFIQKEKVRASNLLILKRDFWNYDDFRDAYLNQSFGLQSFVFNQYAWNNRLAFEFQTYVEEYFPVSEHSHLTYFEYCQLLRYFYFSYVGVRLRPALSGKTDRLRPLFGVSVPEKPARIPILLFRTWLENFQRSLGLHRALIVKAGCGLTAMVTRHCGVRMVTATDPDPRCVMSAKQDSKRMRFHDISYRVAEFFPPITSASASGSSSSSKSQEQTDAYVTSLSDVVDENENSSSNKNKKNKQKYDMIVFSPDISFLQLSQNASNGVDVYAPSMTGVRGELEQFFEQAHHYLNDRGVVVIIFSNFLQLAYPREPHPIELEIKANRRWVVLDYYDHKMKAEYLADVSGLGARMQVFRNIAKDLRAELWVLHRVEQLYNFGWIHGIPGCRAPSDVSAGKFNAANGKRRLKMLKQRLFQDNSDWGDYEQRILRAISQGDDNTSSGENNENDSSSENSSENNNLLKDDDFSQQVKMALDPTYSNKLANQARRVIEKKDRDQQEFHKRVAFQYSGSKSPRDVYDSEQEKLFSGVKKTPAEFKGEGKGIKKTFSSSSDSKQKKMKQKIIERSL